MDKNTKQTSRWSTSGRRLAANFRHGNIKSLFVILLALETCALLPSAAAGMTGDELTEALLAAPGKAERLEVAGANADVVTAEYIDGLIGSARGVFFGGDADGAFRILEAAEELSELTGNELARAWCVFNRGNYLFYEGRNAEALEQFAVSLEISRRAGDGLGAANCYQRRGDVYFNSGDNEKALEMYGLALQLYRKEGDALGEANCLRNEGDVLFRTGDNGGAVERYEAALPLFKEAGSLIGEANCYVGQGDVLFRAGDNQRAFERYEAALPLFREAGSALGEANCYKSLGDLFLFAGDARAAVERYGLALPLYERAQSPVGKANCYMRLGAAFLQTGDSRAALEKYGAALALYKRAEFPLGEANSYQSIGDVFLNAGDAGAALEKYESALPLYIKTGDPLGEANCYQREGDAAFMGGEYKTALEKYESANPLYERINDAFSLMWNYYSVGKTQRAAGNKAAALEMFEGAISKGEFLGERAGSDDMRRGTIEQQTDIYGETIDLLLEMGRDEEAFGVLEKMRGAALRGMLERGRVDALARAPEGVRLEAARLRAEMGAAAGELVKEIQRPGGGDKAAARALRERHDAAARRLDSLMSEAAGAYGGVAAAGAGTKSLGVDDIRASLPPGAALVEYFLGEKRAVVFALSGDAFVRRDLPCDGKKIDALANSFLAKAVSGGMMKTGALYDCLIAPVEKEAGAASLVLVSPDKILNYLPFDALRRDGDVEYAFWARRPVVYTLSGTMFVSDKLRAEKRGGKFSGGNVLAVGGADFGGGGERGEAGKIKDEGELMDESWKRGARSGLAELPGTIPEVKKIGELYGASATVLLGGDATEANVKKEMAGKGVVHFSTHGLLNLDDPMSSALAFSEIGMRARGLSPDEDGFLTAREIMADPRIDLGGGLAVLSACETGKGELSGSEGVIGLTRAFAVAGARAEIVSLWSVADDSTSLLFQYFYEHLKNGEKPAEALAAAKEELRSYLPAGESEPPYAAPFFWAPFIYAGVP